MIGRVFVQNFGIACLFVGAGVLPVQGGSLLVEFKFDDGSLANTGTLGGIGTFVAGPNGQNAVIGAGLSGIGQGMDNSSAPDFGAAGGSGGTLTFPSHTGYANLTSYTVSGFYKIPEQNSALAGTNGAHLFRIKSGANPDVYYELGRIGNDGHGTPDFSTRQIWGPTDSDGTFQDNAWVFFAMTYDGAGGADNVKYYGANSLNSTVQQLATGTLAGPSTGNVSSGIDIGNTFGGIRPFDGLLDNIRLHGSKTDATGALDLATLQGLATAGFNEANGGGGPAVNLASLSPSVLRPKPPGAPGLSDIPLSSRWPRPDGGGDPYNTFQAIEQFHATRLDWNYPRNNNTFISQIKNAGLYYAGTINSELPDQIGGSTRLIARDKDMFGVPIHNPELPASSSARGDINDPAYRQIVTSFIKFTIDAGGDMIMVDDPGMTYTNMLDLGGGYGDASLVQFRDYLVANSTATQRASWGMPANMSDFNYANYAVSRNNGATVPSAVRNRFRDFHRQGLDNFYETIRSELNAYAGRVVPFAFNNGSTQIQTDYQVEYADFWLGETGKEYGNPTATGIYNKVKNAEQLGKVQVFSPPNDSPTYIPTRAEYVSLSRKIIATSYASGSSTLVPWDVWRRGMNERFFGTVAEFGDIYEMIAQNPQYYDDHEEVFAAGAGVLPQRAPGLNSNPLEITGGSGQVFSTVRVDPGNLDASIVIHLTDWGATPAAFSISLVNEMFGFDEASTMRAALLIPGVGQTILGGTLGAAGRTTFNLPALNPYALLVVNPDLMPGDYDFNGLVDGNDYQVWRQTYGSQSNLSADGNQDGVVNTADYTIWRNNFGSGGGSVSTVPEPSSALLFVVAVTAGLAAARRRTS